MADVIEKVTAFITRQTDSGYQLLLLEHPYAGIQIPAGTVESFEGPERAVIREAVEETGLTISSRPVNLGCQETKLEQDQAIIKAPCKVYARPDHSSFDWAEIRSAVQVKLLRKSAGFTQISYIEHDQVPNQNYVSMQIMGWVRNDFLAQLLKRHFFLLDFQGITQPRWEIFNDHHKFSLFWASWSDLPTIIPPQDSWLKYLREFTERKEQTN